MNILFLTQYYPPEVGAPQERLSFLARFLARHHRVTVVTAQPNYPGGELYDGFENRIGRITRTTDASGIDIFRSWIYLTHGDKGFSKRLRSYLSFAWSSLGGWRRVGAYDVVFVETPPIFLSFTASVFAKLGRAKKVVHYADPWVAFAVEFGYLKSGSVPARAAAWLESRALNWSDLVVVPNPGIYEGCLLMEGLGPDKLKLVMNGVDEQFYKPDSGIREEVRQRMGWQDRFVVTFAGTHALQAGLDVLVRTAALLRTSLPDVLFLLVGDGADKPRIEALAREAGVLDQNLLMMPIQPATVGRDLLNASDVGVNPLVAGMKTTDRTLSVKLLSYMAMGLPVIATDRKVQRKIINDGRCGILCEGDDAGNWARAVETLYRDEPLRRRLGALARKHAEDSFSRSRLAAQMEQHLLQVVGSGSRTTDR